MKKKNGCFELNNLISTQVSLVVLLYWCYLPCGQPQWRSVPGSHFSNFSWSLLIPLWSGVAEPSAAEKQWLCRLLSHARPYHSADHSQKRNQSYARDRKRKGISGVSKEERGGWRIQLDWKTMLFVRHISCFLNGVQIGLLNCCLWSFSKHFH